MGRSRGRSHLRMKSLISIFCFIAIGCAASDFRESVPALAELASSLQDASTKSTHLIRWNPTNCDCPPWELKTKDRWIRVQIDSKLEEVAQEQFEASKTAQSCEVSGVLYPAPYRCGPSLLCGFLEVRGLSNAKSAL